MAELPSMPLATDAYLGDTTHLTTTEHGAYLLLLIAMWRAGGSLPDDEKLLARYAKVTAGQWRRMAPVLMEFFERRDGRITQSRLTREYERVRQHRAQQSDKARAKWLKDKGQGSAAAYAADMPPKPKPKPKENTPLTPRKRGERRREGQAKKAIATYPERFNEFWAAYPRKVGKAAAFEAWRKYDHEAQECARLAAPRFAADMAAEERPPDKIPHAATWLNQQRFTDYYEPEYDTDAARHEQPDERADDGDGRGGDAPQGAGKSEGEGGVGAMPMRPAWDTARRPELALRDMFRHGPQGPTSSGAAHPPGRTDARSVGGRSYRQLH